ncbi:MAG TPA: hypothetical protein VGN51_04395 [Acidimicrobiia bacterium]
MAVLVSFVPAAAGADAASQPAQLHSKDEIPVSYNQGIARIRGGWILTGTLSPIPKTDVIVRTDEQFNVVERNDAAIPDEWRTQGYVHIGDIDVVGDIVYAPFEQPDYAQGHQVTARYDARTLRFLDAVELDQNENSFVAVDPKTRIAYSMDNFDGDALLRYDVAHKWKPLRPLKLSMLLQHTQGASIADGAVWISTSDAHNDIYRVNIKTGHVDLVAQITDPPGEGEGIAVAPLPSGYLHTTVLDPDMTKVWVEHFSRPGAGAGTTTTGSR